MCASNCLDSNGSLSSFRSQAWKRWTDCFDVNRFAYAYAEEFENHIDDICSILHFHIIRQKSVISAYRKLMASVLNPAGMHFFIAQTVRHKRELSTVPWHEKPSVSSMAWGAYNKRHLFGGKLSQSDLLFHVWLYRMILVHVVMSVDSCRSIRRAASCKKCRRPGMPTGVKQKHNQKAEGKS